MLLAAVAIAVGLPILWAMSVGARRDIRRLRALDPAWTGCATWVRVRGVPGRRYRCGQPLAVGGDRCPRHDALARRNDLDEPAGRDIEEPQAVGRAIAQIRIAVPVAIVAVLATIGLVAALV